MIASLTLTVIILLSTETTSESTEVFAYQLGYPDTFSSRNSNILFHMGRLDDPDYCWAASPSDLNQWAQISSIVPQTWIAVITQGRSHSTHNQWVTHYQVRYTLNGREWIFVDGGRNFTGNSDQTTWVRNNFTTPVFARAIRIQPTAWSQHISMRFDVLFRNI